MFRYSIAATRPLNWDETGTFVLTCIYGVCRSSGHAALNWHESAPFWISGLRAVKSMGMFVDEYSGHAAAKLA